MKFIQSRIVFLFLILSSPIFGQKSDPKNLAIEKHYEFLETEIKNQRDAIQKENEAYRKFIQEERVGHREFIENTIKVGGGLIALAVAFLTFFGFDTFKSIRNSRKEIEIISSAKLIEYKEKIESNAALYEVQIQETKLKLAVAEQSYQKFINFYSSADPRSGQFVVIGDAEKIKEMKGNELYRFVQVFNLPDFIELGSEQWKNFDPKKFDLVIYRSNVNSSGEDSDLEHLIDLLKTYSNIPLLVYAKGQSEFIKGKTDLKLKDSLFHIANNPVTLIDNTIAAYRVTKILEPKPDKD
jgi:hypothetical protein